MEDPRPGARLTRVCQWQHSLHHDSSESPPSSSHTDPGQNVSLACSQHHIDHASPSSTFSSFSRSSNPHAPSRSECFPDSLMFLFVSRRPHRHWQRWRLCVGYPGTGYPVATLNGMQALLARQPQGTHRLGASVSPASLEGNLGIIRSQTPRRSSQVSR
jgi:hypothetical protein